MANNPAPLPVLRTLVEKHAFEMLSANPLGFTMPELLARARNGTEWTIGDRRVRNQLDRLCRENALISPDRGVFIAGSTGSDIADLASEVRQIFAAAGGFCTFENVLSNLPNELSHSGRVRTLLATSDEYEIGLPMAGLMKVWRLRDHHRVRVPLPGRWQLLDLKMMKCADGPVPKGWGLLALAALRRRIGQGIRDARVMRGMDIDAIVAHPLVRAAFDNRLVELKYADPTEVVGYERWLVEEWDEVSLFEAWDGMESANSGDCFQGIIDTRCWNAIGGALKLDPALLSRGSLGRPVSL